MPDKRSHSSRTNGHKGQSGLAIDESTAAGLSLGLEGGPVREDVYKTRRGAEIQINGVSPWLMEGLAEGLRAEWAEGERGSLEPPTYDIPLPGGEVETRAHDKTTLNTDEDRAEWAAYEARVAAFQHELQERTMRVLLMRGVASNPPDGGQWEAEQKFMGIRIPSDAMGRRYHWLKTEVVTSPEEITTLMARILTLSGIRGEALLAAEAAFRSQMEESERPAAKRATPNGRRLVSKPDHARGKDR